MKFDSKAGPNPADARKVLGQPHVRIEGVLKVTGTAPYAYERHDVADDQAYGVIVGAGIATGRIKTIDTATARSAPGVLGIVTYLNAGPLKAGEFYKAMPLAGPEVQHYHQAVAVVIAETFEQARAAAMLVRVDYIRSPGQFDLEAVRGTGVVPPAFPDTHVGDFEKAFAAAPVSIDQTYSTPDQAHVMMEPHATIAAWNGDKVTLWTSLQIVQWGLSDFAQIMGMPKENITISSPYVGGGFGGKATILSDAVMAALAAREVGRPVKVTLARPHLFNNTTHRAATIQRLRIGATRDGHITAIGHDAWDGNLPGGMSARAPLPTPLLYAGANRRTSVRQARLDLPEASAMRGPGEAPGLMAIEVAIDELAEKLGMDPVQLRILNDTQVNPAKPGKRFSVRQMKEAFEVGADRFGWAHRNAKPGQRREGRWLIGMGTAAAIRGGPISTSGARVRLTPEGMIVVESDMTDIGTGSYTIMAQTAAEIMGVPLDHVTVKLAESSFPAASGSLGQRGAASSTAGVYAACVKLRGDVAARLGVNAANIRFEDGHIISGGRRVPLVEVAKGGEIVAEDKMEYDENYTAELERQTFGAHFVEVAVDAMTGEVRMRRMLAVCAAGRILNPKTARSQVIGAMTMGVGAALMVELAVDTRFGFFVNHDMAGYEVPVHADIPHQDVIFIDEEDSTVSPLRAKGVGELGICSVAAAIANAIYNATGVRTRDYPITLDKSIRELPRVS